MVIVFGYINDFLSVVLVTRPKERNENTRRMAKIAQLSEYAESGYLVS